MNQLNSLIIEGNIVKAGDFSEPAEGFKVYRFPVAVNRWYKNKNNEGVSEVSYFDVEAYDNVADFCSKYGTKGRGIRVVGRLKQNRWDDSDGKSHSRVLIVAEHIELKPEYSEEKSKNEKAPVSEKEAEAVTAEKTAAAADEVNF